jgi:hypothetical protein
MRRTRRTFEGMERGTFKGGMNDPLLWMALLWKTFAYCTCSQHWARLGVKYSRSQWLLRKREEVIKRESHHRELESENRESHENRGAVKPVNQREPSAKL